MKITKQRLKEIIKEEFTKYEWEALKLRDQEAPFVLRMSGKGETYFHGLAANGTPKFGPRDGAHEYRSIDKAMNRQSALKDDGEGLAEVLPAGTLRLKGNPSREKIAQLRRKLKYGFEDWRK